MRSSRRHPVLLSALVLAVLAAVGSTALASRSADAGKSHHAEPLVIGHRGAAGYRPEHTLASYELGARMGADYIEPDLVSTKDHVLVARHEPDITDTTDVASHPEFAGRKTTKTIDGVSTTGWFTDDFTLAELRTLRAKERLPDVRQHNTIYDGRFKIPTFQEVINLTKRLSSELHRKIGIYPETKHPSYFRAEGLPLEGPLVRTLRANHLDGRGAKVFVQSFETKNLEALNKQIDVPLVALLDTATKEPADRAGSGVTYGDLATAAGLRKLARFADGVGPSKEYVIPRDAAGRSQAPTSFVAEAHRAGLVVHPYTFRAENQFLPLELRSSADPNAYGDLFKEIEMFRDAGVDGVFSDNPDIAVETLHPH